MSNISGPQTQIPVVLVVIITTKNKTSATKFKKDCMVGS